jgi:transposase-like protein
MKSGGARERWSAEKFAAVLAAQRSSGLSVQAYCRREGINLSTFYRWRVVTQGPGKALSKTTERRSRSVAKQNAFVDLSDAVLPASLTLRFELGNGISLTVSR